MQIGAAMPVVNLAQAYGRAAPGARAQAGDMLDGCPTGRPPTALAFGAIIQR
jgi:hypothetical protein